jgi:hypothetical protein
MSVTDYNDVMYRGVAGDRTSDMDSRTGGFQLLAKFIFEVKKILFRSKI